MKEAEFNKQKELDSSLNNLTDFKSYVDKFLPAQSKKSDDELNSEHSTIEDSLIIDEDKKEKGILEPTMSAEEVQKYLPFGVVFLYNIGEAIRVPKEVVDGLGLQYALTSEGSAIEILGNYSGNIVYVYGEADRKLVKQQLDKVIPNYGSRWVINPYDDSKYRRVDDGSSTAEYRWNDSWKNHHDTPVGSSLKGENIITNFAPYLYYSTLSERIERLGYQDGDEITNSSIFNPSGYSIEKEINCPILFIDNFEQRNN
jgi:hypothetical protein